MNKRTLILSNLFLLLVIIAIAFKEKYPQRIWHKLNPPQVVKEEKLNYWLCKDALFAALPKDSNSIVFLGTSLTDNFEITEIFHRCDLKNRGITADITEGMLNRLQPIIEDDPRKVFIEAGVNDLGKGISSEKLLENYQAILTSLKNSPSHPQLYIQSILPVANSGQYPEYNNPAVNAEIKKVNKALQAMADKNKATYIDLYSKFVLNDAIDPRFVIDDGIHLTGAAYKLWAEIIRPYIDIVESK